MIRPHPWNALLTSGRSEGPRLYDSDEGSSRGSASESEGGGWDDGPGVPYRPAPHVEVPHGHCLRCGRKHLLEDCGVTAAAAAGDPYDDARGPSFGW